MSMFVPAGKGSPFKISGQDLNSILINDETGLQTDHFDRHFSTTVVETTDLDALFDQYDQFRNQSQENMNGKDSTQSKKSLNHKRGNSHDQQYKPVNKVKQNIPPTESKETNLK